MPTSFYVFYVPRFFTIFLPDVPSFFNVNYISSSFHVPYVPSSFARLICLLFSCVLRALVFLRCLTRLHYLGDLGAFIFLSALLAFKRTPDLIKDWKLYYQRVGSIVLMKRTYWKKFLEEQNIFESLQVQSGRKKMKTVSQLLPFFFFFFFF